MTCRSLDDEAADRGARARGARSGVPDRLRRRILDWGASEAEAAARLPGDELLEQADGVATRAVTIDAPPSAVWPWIAQMGAAPRGGAYTYDRIENLLGLTMHSVDRVLPEYQHPQVGEGFGMEPGSLVMDRKMLLGIKGRAEPLGAG